MQGKFKIFGSCNNNNNFVTLLGQPISPILTILTILAMISAQTLVISIAANYSFAAKPDFVSLKQMTKRHSVLVSMIVPANIPSKTPIDITLEFNPVKAAPLTNIPYDFRVVQNNKATYQQVGVLGAGGETSYLTVTPEFEKGPGTISVILGNLPSGNQSSSSSTSLLASSIPLSSSLPLPDSVDFKVNAQ